MEDKSEKPKKHDSKCNNLIVVSDTHIGCAMGLQLPDGFKRVDDIKIMPSDFQKKLYEEYWHDFWHSWVPRVTKREPYDVVINGDVTDGDHHGGSTQWTHNLADQVNCAVKIFEPIAEKVHNRGGRLWVIKGTAAHDGENGRDSESFAKRIEANQIKGSEASTLDELYIRVGDALVHLLHHIGTTSSSAHEASAVNAELTAFYVDAARWQEEAPAYVVRSHRHRSIVVDIDAMFHNGPGYAAGIVTPGWQGKTPFAFRIAGSRVTQPQFGGFLIRQGDEEHFYRRKIYQLNRPEVQ